MPHLLDTQIFIWALISPEKLSLQTKSLMQNHEIFISQITLFEIAIKQKIGKLLELDIPIYMLANQIEQDGFILLPLKTCHIESYSDIPLFADHRDPFDRILLSTALSENMPIISADRNFELYSSKVHILMNG